jgi:hypothetical protein
VGLFVGTGDLVGTGVGLFVGLFVGTGDGLFVGLGDGALVGFISHLGVLRFLQLHEHLSCLLHGREVTCARHSSGHGLS